MIVPLKACFRPKDVLREDVLNCSICFQEFKFSIFSGLDDLVFTRHISLCIVLVVLKCISPDSLSFFVFYVGFI
jgi:hypothetical protein